MIRTRILACTLVILLATPRIFPGSILFAGDTDEDTTVPLPYEREEFPEWAWDVRRGEIIALGVFPVAMIVSGIGLQLGRFAYQSVQEGQFSQEYAPFFLSTGTGPRYDERERVGLIISAGVISFGVALADFFLGRREARQDAQRREARIRAESDRP